MSDDTTDNTYSLMQGDQILYRWGPVASLHKERSPSHVGPGLVRWADESPFGVPGVDCRSRSLGAVSVTTDKADVQRFDFLRAHDGSTFEGAMPEDAVAHDCWLAYPTVSARHHGVLFAPRIFEDRFVMYQRPGAITVVGSWSGHVHAVAGWQPQGTGIVIRRVWAEPTHASVHPTPFAVQELDFLMKSHVLDRWCPHPAPPSLGRDSEAIANAAWLEYGQRGLFATDADTTAVEAHLER